MSTVSCKNLRRTPKTICIDDATRRCSQRADQNRRHSITHHDHPHCSVLSAMAKWKQQATLHGDRTQPRTPPQHTIWSTIHHSIQPVSKLEAADHHLRSNQRKTPNENGIPVEELNYKAGAINKTFSTKENKIVSPADDSPNKILA